MESVLRFEILGPQRAWRDGEELELGPGKQRAVLAVLLLHAGSPVPTTQIVDAVWQDEPPENGPNVVQKYVAGLRRVLEPDRSPRTPGQLLTLAETGYVLRVGPGCLDADVFDQRVRRAHAARTRGRLADASTELRAALALWRGEPFPGLTGPVFDAARARLVEKRATALEAWADVALRLGQHREMVGDLMQLTAEFPVREPLRAALMLALYRCGRQAEALAVFRDLRAFLADEYGIEPGEPLQNLHRQILRSDPALAPPPTAAEPTPPPQVPAEPPPPAPADPPPPALADPPPPGPAAPPAPPVPARTGRRWLAWVGTTLGLALSLASFGFLTWAVVLYYAGRRRSPALGVATAAYVALIGLFVVAMETSDEDVLTALDVAGLLGWVATWLGGAVHIVLLNEHLRGLLHRRGRQPVLAAEAGRRLRREQARHLLRHYPAARGELRIGRPDLPRGYDDGGLVDINSVAAEVIEKLPGLAPHQGRHIAIERQLRGPFGSLEDLAARCLLPLASVEWLRDVLLFLPPAPLPPAPLPPTAAPAGQPAPPEPPAPSPAGRATPFLPNQPDAARKASLAPSDN